MCYHMGLKFVFLIAIVKRISEIELKCPVYHLRAAGAESLPQAFELVMFLTINAMINSCGLLVNSGFPSANIYCLPCSRLG